MDDVVPGGFPQCVDCFTVKNRINTSVWTDKNGHLRYRKRCLDCDTKMTRERGWNKLSVDVLKQRMKKNYDFAEDLRMYLEERSKTKTGEVKND